MRLEWICAGRVCLWCLLSMVLGCGVVLLGYVSCCLTWFGFGGLLVCCLLCGLFGSACLVCCYVVEWFACVCLVLYVVCWVLGVAWLD